MSNSTTGRRGALLLSAAVLLLTAACGTGTASQALPPASPSVTEEVPASPPISQSPPAAVQSPSDEQEPSASPAQPVSKPVALQVPGIGLSSDLLELGQHQNGTLEVPPEDAGSPAGWYTGSPKPGETGPAVLLGHVNSLSRTPGIFARLPELEKGDRITVISADGAEYEFAVERIEQYTKKEFPTLKVYGNTEGPELRLITCDGYNSDTGIFDDNLVVYAAVAPAASD